MSIKTPNTPRNLGIIFALMAFYCGLYLLATEYISMYRSRGEVLLFRRGKLPEASTREDEENNLGIKHTIHPSNEPSVSTTFTAGEKVPATYFFWNEISYDIKVQKGQKRILDNVEGWVKPGTLTTLMVGIWSLQDQ